MSSLTPQQLSHFHAFGFLHLHQLYSPAETRRIVAEAQADLEEDRGGGTPTSQALTAPLERRPVLRQLLLEDDRILGRVRQLMGGRRCLWTGSELNSGTVDPAMWEATPAGSQEHGWCDMPCTLLPSAPIFLLPSPALRSLLSPLLCATGTRIGQGCRRRTTRASRSSCT